MKKLVSLITLMMALPVYAQHDRTPDRPPNQGNQLGSRVPQANDKILGAARKSLGKPMWFGYGLQKGTLGCAAALSNVLKQAGYSQCHSALVTTVRHQLLALPGAQEIVVKQTSDALDIEKLAKLARPGDVLLAFMDTPAKLNGGADAHCGIMDREARVFTNDWNDGIWKNAPFDQYFHYYKELRLVRLKQKA
jgi:hypothetical protein